MTLGHGAAWPQSGAGMGHGGLELSQGADVVVGRGQPVQHFGVVEPGQFPASGEGLPEIVLEGLGGQRQLAALAGQEQVAVVFELAVEQVEYRGGVFGLRPPLLLQLPRRMKSLTPKAMGTPTPPPKVGAQRLRNSRLKTSRSAGGYDVYAQETSTPSSARPPISQRNVRRTRTMDENPGSELVRYNLSTVAKYGPGTYQVASTRTWGFAPRT